MKTNNNANETNSDYRDEVAQIMTIPRPIVVMSREFPPGHITPFHSHARAQLLYASSGVMTVTTDNGIWVVPPLRAIWIPAHTHHQRKASGLLSIRTLFIQHDYFPDAPSSCCVVAVSTLLKELILYATTIPRLYPLEGASARLMRVILDQIQVMDVKPLSLSIPAQPKLKQIFSQLCAAPGDKRTLEEWGNSVGATKRTLSRLFQADIGMSFSQWRQQIRILEALRRLAQGEAVTSVAIDLGYDSPSAFISMFKKALGKTPGQYFSTR